MPRNPVSKVARRLGVSTRFLRGCPQWMQEGRGATEEEFTIWVRGQHKRACKEYQAAYPISFYQGKCFHMLHFKKPCVPFFAHTGICETGIFHPERIKNDLPGSFGKSARRASRDVAKMLGK